MKSRIQVQASFSAAMADANGGTISQALKAGAIAFARAGLEQMGGGASPGGGSGNGQLVFQLEAAAKSMGLEREDHPFRDMLVSEAVKRLKVAEKKAQANINKSGSTKVGEAASGPGKWVTTNVDKRSIRNFFQMLAKRTGTIGEEQGRLWGSEGKDFEYTIQDVTQTWTALTTDEAQILTGKRLVSVTRSYGETRIIKQIYLEGPDPWNVKGRSWYWQPIIGREEFEFLEHLNP